MKREVWNPEFIAEWVTESCRAQGVPVKVTDPATLRKVTVLLKVPVKR